jgi:3-oxoacyl-[acyl-carrier-protein] synthase-3
MDVFAACSGFLYGLTMVESMIRTEQIKYALVIGAEVLTKYVDYTDRSTCVIFGDGAGAAVLGPVNSGRGILATKIKSDGRYEEQLYAPGGGTKLGTTHKTIDDRMHFFKMKGNELFKVAVRSMADISAEMLEKGRLQAGRRRPRDPASGEPAYNRCGCVAARRAGREGLLEHRRTR